MNRGRFAAYLFGLVLAVYLLTSPGHMQVIDVYAELEVSRSLVRHGDFIVRVPLDTIRARDGRTYSVHDPGESLLLSPAVLVGDLLQPGSEQRYSVFETDAPDGFIGSFLSPLAVAATAAILALLVVDVGFGFGTALATALVMAFATYMWSYAHDSFDMAPATAAIVAAVYSTYRFREGRRWQWLLASGVATAIAGLIRLPDFLILAPLAVYLVVGQLRGLPGRLRSLVLWSLPSIAVLGGYAWYNSVRYANLQPGGGVGPGRFSANLFTSLPALMFSPGLGLFVYSPALLIGVLGTIRLVKRDAALAATLIAAVAINALFYAKYVAWIGGDAWGPRFLLPLAPLLLVGAAEVFNRWRGLPRTARVAVVGLLVLSVVFQLASVLIDFSAQTVSLGQADGNHQYWDRGASLLLKHLAVILGSMPDLTLQAVVSGDGHHGLDFWWVRGLQDGVSPWLVLPPLVVLLVTVGGTVAGLRRVVRGSAGGQAAAS